jgi:hypothetical protein
MQLHSRHGEESVAFHDSDNRPDRSDSTIRAASRGCRIGGFAFWHARCRRDGDAARHVLHRLLRGRYAAPFRRCRYGFALGRGLDGSSDEREASARSKNLAADDCCWVHCRRCGLGASRLESGITQNSASLRAPHPRHTFITAAELAGYGLGKLVVRVLSLKLGDQQTSTILPADPGSRISLCARAASASGNSLLTTGRRVPFSRPAKRPA